MLSVTAWPGAALAHAILVASVPAPEGRVPAGALALALRYNSRIDAERSKLTLRSPDGGERRLALVESGRPDALRADVTLAPGAYVVRWQVLAIDGHITRGDVPFEVVAP